ncbi:hypothetical protein IQ277_16370 [Nostocales cyanobacterium LEGE 12452]|nr:hypothetical protein [Nostocales cyanobacterium LEGE 12452]
MKLMKGCVLTLALTTFLSWGFGLTENNSAGAASRLDTTPLAETLQARSSSLPRAIANKILRDASKRSGVPVGELRVIQVISKTFSNPCEFKFGEICTREYNPIEGWKVVVRVRQDSWTYHVNKSGTQIVLDPKISALHILPKTIAYAILTDASNRSGVAIADLKITQATPKTFGNSCVFGFGEVCIQIFDPIEGWEVIVKVKGQFWTYHVNKSGSQIVLDPKVTAIKKN